jgi:hypothetical protein
MEGSYFLRGRYFLDKKALELEFNKGRKVTLYIVMELVAQMQEDGKQWEHTKITQ